MYGLYIHIPFCIKKCNYCDFVSFTEKDALFDEYIDALLLEAKEYETLSFDTVFIGGGTPTVLSPKQLERLLSGIRSTLKISDNAEFSIEANPKTLTEEKLITLYKNGVNRISIGVQSFIDSELSFLGRIHSSRDAISTIELAKKYFDNFNLDLMFALPNQTKEDVLFSLKTAVSLSPAHISCYSLILEEGTPLFCEFEKGNLTLQDEDTDRNNFEAICNFLKENGYSRYEVSNFALDGFECRHNLKYWDCDEYIGLGLAAHSYFDGKRFYNTSDFKTYIEGNFHDEFITLSEKDKMSEFMIMGLRKTNGIKISEFEKRFFKNPCNIYNMEKFQKLGLIINDGEKIRLTERGMDVSNSVLCEFV